MEAKVVCSDFVRFTSLGNSGKWRRKAVMEVASQSEPPMDLPFTPPPLCPFVQM